jgi:hypothetical protein
MNDFYLKTTDLTTLWNLLLDQGLAETFIDSDGRPHNVAKGITLDIIGTIYKPTGNMITIEGGFQIMEQLPVDGFHANIRGELTEAQQAALPLIDAPATPYRVWA